MGNLGFGEVVVLFVLAFVFLGPDKLLGLAKDLKKAFGNFTRLKNDFEKDVQEIKTQLHESTHPEENKEETPPC